MLKSCVYSVRPAQWWCFKPHFNAAKTHQTAGVTMTLNFKGAFKFGCMRETLVKYLILV